LPYNLENDQCNLQCAPGYWANQASTYNTASDALDQRCTWHNCKNWDYNANDPLRTAKTCTLCWDHADISAYATWDAKSSYKDKELVGRDTAEPFRLHTGQCGLQCKLGFWSNWKSAYNSASDALDQRCTSDNCKDWDYTSANSSDHAKKCTMCWDKLDMADYTKWDGRGSYTEQEIQYRFDSEPYL
jgi:hypothetical protein